MLGGTTAGSPRDSIGQTYETPGRCSKPNSALAVTHPPWFTFGSRARRLSLALGLIGRRPQADGDHEIVCSQEKMNTITKAR